MSYPTQEDELRAKEADAQDSERNEESRFLSAFRTIPENNRDRLLELATSIVDNFNTIMESSRREPYERQEDLMAGMKRLFREQVNVIEARRIYTVKINPTTASTPEKKNL